MSDCVFCGIVEGRLPASTVYEDEIVVAFMDTRPVNPGHLLVVPKRHFEFMNDMDEETGAHLFRVTMRIQQAMRRSLPKCEGINFFLADGAVAGQEVPHVHLHVLPRFVGDPFRLQIDYGPAPDRGELNETAAQICAALDRVDER